jgi:hypothetical protein
MCPSWKIQYLEAQSQGPHPYGERNRTGHWSRLQSVSHKRARGRERRYSACTAAVDLRREANVSFLFFFFFFNLYFYLLWASFYSTVLFKKKPKENWFIHWLLYWYMADLGIGLMRRLRKITILRVELRCILFLHLEGVAADKLWESVCKRVCVRELPNGSDGMMILWLLTR